MIQRLTIHIALWCAGLLITYKACAQHYLNHIDSVLMNYDAIEKRIPYHQKVKRLQVIIGEASELNDLLGAANACRWLGIVYKDNGRLDSAIEVTIRSLKFAEDVANIQSMASSLNQLAVIYQELENNKDALYYFTRAFSVNKTISSGIGMSDALFNIAELKFDVQPLYETEEECLRSLQYARLSHDTSTVGYNYNLLSRICLRKKNVLLATRFASIAVWLLQRDEDIKGLIPAMLQLGECQILSGRNDSAHLFFKKAYMLAKQYSYHRWIARTAKLLSQTVSNRDSMQAYLKVCIYEDSIVYNDRITKATIDAMTHYETDKKQMALDNQQQLTLVFTILSVLLLITIIILIINFRQRRKIVKRESELQNANAMLQGQDAERERIAKELHDRVGSMLSTVKHHFNAMEMHMGDFINQQQETYGKALGLLDETYEEVRRISHDLDSGLLGRFGFKTAMLHLTQALESSNGLKVFYLDNNIESVHYKPFETDLYRITQELLTNTIKYASAREISIQLSYNNGNLVYSYEDDGVGFDKKKLQQSIGIGYKNIDIRVKKIGGSWHLDTSPGHGINLIIEIPHGADTGSYSR